MDTHSQAATARRGHIAGLRFPGCDRPFSGPVDVTTCLQASSVTDDSLLLVGFLSLSKYFIPLGVCKISHL